MADLPPNKGDRPKRHHTVPKFYLERFAVDGSVELVRRDDLTTSFPRTIEQALTENYFYSIEVEEGRDPLGETMLADQVEAPAAEAIRRMFDQGRPLVAPGPRAAISIFLAFQYLRGPGTRHALVEQHKGTIAKMASMTTPAMVMEGARERGEDMTEEDAADIAEFATSGDYTLEIERQSNLHLGIAFPAVFEIVRFFERRHWRVLEFDEPCLITSDEPVALVGDPHRPGGGGGLPYVREIVVPIDPRRALVMVRPDLGAEDRRHWAGPAQAKIINEHVAFSAHRFIVRTPGTNPLAGIKLPEKAPPVFVVGDFIGMAPNVSVEARAKMIERMRKHQPRRPAR
jgi:hypothetical protein